MADGNDDIKGLIDFVRGKDYFDYNGGVLDEDRASTLADIYHSQHEVGPPGANTLFTSNNQEAYWGHRKDILNLKEHKDRPRIIYAGSNEYVTLRADCKEEWAFIPPMVASSLPLVINKSYDGKFKKSQKPEDLMQYLVLMVHLIMMLK